MAFTPSGNVIPAAGNINFNSNASSNAVRQVFGESTSNMLGLVGSNYNSNTRPPGYTATLTVPGPNLSLSFFAGKSIFLASPVTLTITTPMTVPTSLTTNVSGGGGTSFYVMVGTSSTGTNILSNVAAGVAAVTIASNTNYYISAYGSNAAGASSLLVSNASPFVSSVPPTPTGISFTTTTTAMTPTFTASTGNAATTYRGKIGTTSGGTELGNAVAVTSGSPTTISVASNTFVYLTIAGSNVLGIGTYSSVIGPIVSSTPQAPTALSLTVSGKTSYVGTWTNPSGNGLTTVSWSITGTGVNNTGSGIVTTTGTQISTLTYGATYTLSVTPSNAKGSSNATTSAVAYFPNIVSTSGSYTLRSGGVGTTSIGFRNPSTLNTYSVTVVGYAFSGAIMHFTYDGGGVQAGGYCTLTINGGASQQIDDATTTYAYSVPTSTTYTIVLAMTGFSQYVCCTTQYSPAGGAIVSMI